MAVHDGDTFKVNIADVHPLLGKKISVRILGINAAEITSADSCEKNVAVKTKTFLENLFKNSKQINLANVGRDKYFRIDADVLVDGINIKPALMKTGLVFPYDGKEKIKRDWCKVAKP